MRKSVIGLLSLAVIGMTGWLSAASEFHRYTPSDWFGVSFTNVAVGTKLSANTGVIRIDGAYSGQWSVPTAANTSSVIEENGVRYLNVFSPVITVPGAVFSTTNKAFAGAGDAYRIDCTTAFPVTDNLPRLPSDVKSAMALSSQNGTLSFYGWSEKGWARLTDTEVVPSAGAVYDQRAEFRRLNGRLYVTYSIKVGLEYIELKDDAGEILLPAAAQGAVTALEFRGIANVQSLEGKRLRSSVTATDVAPDGYPMTLLDWFSAVMQGVPVGTALGTQTGVIDNSGLWDVYSPETFSASVDEDEGDRYLCVAQNGYSFEGPHFTATRAAQLDRSEIEFQARFTRSKGMSGMDQPADVKAALTIDDDNDNRTSFYGYTSDGWVPLSAEGIVPTYDYWYAMMAAFEVEDEKLYVSYFVKTYQGYVPLTDAEGRIRFVANGRATEPAQNVEVLGDTDFKFITGTEMIFDLEHAYYWVGGPLGEWADGMNWSHEPNGTPAATYPKAGDSAVVNTKATIEIRGADANVSNLLANAAVTLKSDRGLSLNLYSGAYGAGRIILSGASMRVAVPDEVSLGCSLEIAAGTENRLISFNDGSIGRQMKLTGKLMGSGTLIFTEPSGLERYANGGGVRLMGDTSEFSGTARFVYDDARVRTGFEAARSCDNVNSRWSFFEEGVVPSAGTGAADTGYLQFPFKTSERTYFFGSIGGTIPGFRDEESALMVRDLMLEIGGREEDSSLDGDWVNADAGRTVRWIGGEGRVFRFDVKNTTLLEVIGGGGVEIGSVEGLPRAMTFGGEGGFILNPDIDPSEIICGSTAPIGVDDGGIDCEWVSPIDGSNIGGFVKRGTGTMRLRAIPRYTGVTRVEEGVLIVPFGTSLGQVEIADGAQLLVDLSNISASDRLIFAAGSSEGGLDGHRLDFINVPPDFVMPDPLWTDDGGVIYSTDTHIFVWTGAADDGGYWSTPRNWQVNGLVATTTPGDYDIVRVPAAVKQHVTVDVPATVWGIQCEEGARAFVFESPGIETSTYAKDSTSLLRVGSGSLPGMRGVGGFQTTSPIVFSVAAGETNRFIGPLVASALTKKGEGEAVISGPNSFNAIALEEGTLRIAGQDDVADLRMDFDATDPFSFRTVSTGKLAEWKSRDRAYSFVLDDGESAALTGEYFGGRTTLMLRPTEFGAYSRYLLTTNGAEQTGSSKSLFIVYHATEVADYSYLYGDKAESRYAMQIFGKDDRHYWQNPSRGNADGFYTGLDPVSSIIEDGKDYLTSWVGTPFTPVEEKGSGEYLGTSGMGLGFKGAVAEVVSYLRPLAHAERIAVQGALMGKWGLGGDYQVVPRMAAMTMKAGAVLDLGGIPQTVASFTGAGVISNGVFSTVSRVITEEGGSLTVPAADGHTFNLMKRKAELVITGGKGKTATVVVPSGCTSGRVFFEGAVDFKISDPGITVQGPEAYWYTIVNIGGGSCIIIR